MGGDRLHRVGKPGAVGQFYGSASEAEIKTSTGVRFNITVLNSDLSICNFIVRNGKA